MNKLTSLLYFSSFVACFGALAPVVFVPGFLGNPLLVTIEAAEFIPASCEGLGVPIGESFCAMYNATLLAKNPQCVYDLLKQDFNATSIPAFTNKPGIKVSVRDFGGFSGIEVTYHSFKTQLTSWGYEVYKDAFGAPLDYRYMSKEGLSYSGFTTDLKALVERAYRRNSDRRVVLIGHSNGGPTLYSFLSSMSLAWKKKYVSSMVGLSGNFLGQMNCIKEFVVPGAQSEMMSTWEAQYMSLPWGEYSDVSTIPIVLTYTNSSENPPQSYTSTVSDLSALFATIDRSEWGAKLAAAAADMDRSATPGVDTYCFYGSNISTSYSFSFAGSVQQQGDDAEVVVGHMEGDGNQDIVDQHFCERVWGAGSSQELRYVTKAQAFPNVHHMQMYSDEGVLAALLDVLQNSQ